MNKQNILIIGGAGYIGSALTEYLHSDHSVTIVDLGWFGNFLSVPVINQDYDQLSQSYLANFDVVILLAGHSSISMCKDDPQNAINNNVHKFSNLISKLTTQKFIYASSAGVYGNSAEGRITEQFESAEPINAYDSAKLQIDQLAQSSDLEYYGLRFGTVAGPSKNTRIDLLINAMVNSAFESGLIQVVAPTRKRSILGIKDLCRAVDAIISNANCAKGIFNVASASSTVGEIGAIVSGLTRKPAHTTFDSEDSNAYEFDLDTGLFEKTFNFKFTDTIHSVTREIVEQYNSINKNSRSLMYTTLDKCLACNSTNLVQFLDLANQPLANNYHDGSGAGPAIPLGLNACTDCWHTQLTVSVDPSVMFDQYVYVTGTSQTLRNYCDWFAEHITSKENITIGSVLDIACNDGTQLDCFKKRGWITYGVDPAKNLFDTCASKGHDVTVAYWPIVTLEKFDVITAQNVCAHTPNPLEFLIGAKDSLAEHGSIFIQTSQSQMYQRNEFDTTYHEHVSFFSVNSMRELALRAGLVLTDVELTPIHSDSYLFTLRHPGSEVNDSVQDMINLEWSQGRANLLFYLQFGENAENILTDLKLTVDQFRSQGLKVVGYGAAAKGMTVLNAANIQLDWIVDDNPLKQGLFTPGTNIEIKDRTSLSKDDDLVIVPLAWNFFDEIKENIQELRGTKHTKFIKYFPEVTVQ